MNESGESIPLFSSSSKKHDDEGGNTEREKDGLLSRAIIVVVLVLISITALSHTFFVVEPGNIGLIVTLGNVAAVESGMHSKVPFVSRLLIFSAKTQKLEEMNDTPTKEGLSVKLDTAILFKLDPTKAAGLYKEVGENYIDTLLQPEAASAIRGFTSESDAKALYSSGRNLIQDAVKSELQSKLLPRGIIIEDVLLKDLVLPNQITAAIEAKVEAQQEAAKMEYVLQKEQQEAQRKSIEAEGIASFQKIVTSGIDANLLKWKGIEATQTIAESQNAKIIIMGNDSNSLPVLLNSD